MGEATPCGAWVWTLKMHGRRWAPSIVDTANDRAILLCLGGCLQGRGAFWQAHGRRR